MSNTRAPIDDPEVRQQHRRQACSDLACLALAVLAFSIVFLTLFALCESGDHAFGTRAPATVAAVNGDDSTVIVRSSDHRIPHRVAFDVHDTDAYASGDRVGVIITGEDHRMVGLDREPMLPLLFTDATQMLAFDAVVIAIGSVPIAWLAYRRRRSLMQPWRRVRVTIFDDGDSRFAYVADGDGSYWRLIGTCFPATGTFDAQIARSSRYLVVRVFGSTEVALARRRRPRRTWMEREEILAAQPTGESAMSAPRCTSVGVSEPRSSSSCLASRK